MATAMVIGARSCVAVKALPKGVLAEVEVIAKV